MRINEEKKTGTKGSKKTKNRLHRKWRENNAGKKRKKNTGDSKTEKKRLRKKNTIMRGSK